MKTLFISLICLSFSASAVAQTTTSKQVSAKQITKKIEIPSTPAATVKEEGKKPAPAPAPKQQATRKEAAATIEGKKK